jgi:Fic family protein
MSHCHRGYTFVKRDELAPILRQSYRPGKPCGVEQVDDPRYKSTWFVIPPQPPTERPGRLPIAALTKAHRILQQLPLIAAADELDRMVSYLFVRREAVQSSRMEGTFSTIDQILTPQEAWQDPGDNNGRSSVLGYALAVDREIASCRKAGVSLFNKALVCRIHKGIMEKDPHFKGQAGQLRSGKAKDSVVWIGGSGRIENSIYNPTPPKHVTNRLQGVMDWFSNQTLVEMGDAGMGLSLPLRLAIGHAHFEAVHPFKDGNGRVGRVLMTLQMAATGNIPVYLSGFIEKEKTDYIRSLEAAQKKLNYSPLIEYICEALVASHKEAEITKVAIRDLPRLWSQRGDFRAGSAAQKALSIIFKNPIFTAKTLGLELRVSPPAVMRAIQQLTHARIIVERTGDRRNRVFAAEEVLRILGRDFGSPIPKAGSQSTT